ncbi:MAG: toll/interleukin-1 receptor domain-containing protein, partial [Bacteroidota bacterium]
MSAIQVFISYAHKDVKAKDRLLTELKILEYLKLIKAWHDGEILPGGSWDDDIRDALGNSDIVILLISPDFAASSYIFTEELPLILERHIQGKTKVLPVL